MDTEGLKVFIILCISQHEHLTHLPPHMKKMVV